MTRVDQLREPVAEILRHPGSQKVITKIVPAGSLELTASHAVPGTDVTLEATLESLGDGIVVKGTISFDWAGECRRCLDEVSGHTDERVEEVFSRLDDGDTYPLGDDEVDLAPLIHEAVLLHLPLAPLCAEDCRGPAPESFPTTLPDDDREPPRDPRWAALDDLDLS